MSVEARSDQLDQRLTLVAQRPHRLQAVALAFIAALSIAQGVILLRVSADTHDAVTAQIPGLQEQVRARNQTIGDQQAVLNDAVGWIVKLADRIKALGGTPPRIVLKPPEHPGPKG